MRASKIVSAATLVGIAMSAQAATCPTLDVPDTIEFRVEERSLTIGTDMEVQHLDGQVFATLDDHVLALGAEYDLLNHDGELVAKAKQKLLSWGVSVRIDDCDGRHLATIEERAAESLFKVHTT